MTGCVGDQLPEPPLINAALSFGADPNQKYRGVSIWALFLGFIADVFRDGAPDGIFIEEKEYFWALELMIKNGAKGLLPQTWLSKAFDCDTCGEEFRLDNGPEERFSRQFPSVTPAMQGATMDDTIYAIGDLLEQFRPRFGSSLDMLKALVTQRDIQSVASGSSVQTASSDAQYR
jgi:hypothetical protein